MQREIQEITNSKVKEIYTTMWASNEFVESISICKTPYRNGCSNNSFVFDIEGEDFYAKREGLKDIFAISNQRLFDDKFEQACAGSANESKRITTLHSSSLCALLFFYNVTEDNPLCLEIAGEKIMFTQSFFEVQNTVILGHNPSNVDVVLLGKQNDKKVILFLESKFSEYYQGVTTSLNISKEYLNIETVSGKTYGCEECLRKLGFTKEIDSEKDYFKLLADDVAYIEGIKQMISHYVGVCNFMSGKIPENERTKIISEYFDSDTKVYLGAILFDKNIGALKIGRHKRCALNSYQNQFKVLASFINNLDCHSKQFKMLSDVLGYSVFEDNNHKIERNITGFYFG